MNRLKKNRGREQRKSFDVIRKKIVLVIQDRKKEKRKKRRQEPEFTIESSPQKKKWGKI